MEKSKPEYSESLVSCIGFTGNLSSMELGEYTVLCGCVCNLNCMCLDSREEGERIGSSYPCNTPLGKVNIRIADGLTNFKPNLIFFFNFESLVASCHSFCLF